MRDELEKSEITIQDDKPLNDRTFEVRGEGMARGKKVVIKELPMNSIKLSKNSRLQITNEDLSGLMQSINSTGLLEPIGVVEVKPGKYEVCYGNRRYMAFSRLGLHSIPAIIHQFKDAKDIDIKNLAENVQRKNISLPEVGRYADILKKQGLTLKELAVRLGAPVSYLEMALSTFNQIPDKFKDDLEMQIAGRKMAPGKINFRNARAILSAAKGGHITKKQSEKLFEMAKENPKFVAEHVPKYIEALRKNKDPEAAVKPVKAITVRFLIDEAEYEKLMREHVENGPFSSFTGIVQAVLSGKKHIKIGVRV
jgi:ParB/RepB/Spo0J family partition protein